MPTPAPGNEPPAVTATDNLTAAGGPATRAPLPGAGSATLRMWVRLLACAKIGEKQLRRKFDEQFDTTLPRFDVLAALDRVPEGLSMSALSRALLVSNGNVTAIVRQLQAQGLVASRTDPHDARSAIVSLTPAGQRQFDTLATAHHAWIAAMLRDVPAERVDQLVRSLGELRAILEERT
ncbi:DNA-binding MarR family transcriptional regulator [Novosphingobium capsulatum]|uniref:DNA-binding MarR family transcriptional regulator n=1 Tax=Novosphingobium capsulatum TaxID=13688 RepID=A0ABU1MMQ7_9SPHN|nr:MULTISPECIES: MarR family winged helix-turn-helix transcriptional regulator [Novosphingobium]MBB3357221.1 DNA-binding MarR family transcriptional regulator [Novosphingobium sp. BK256]MBB3374117.1 DNA-binding MarR family transcriptional regulator [Novosphingobium sp. BK280]MBB3378529.1 DNA-binding MarR family transcriptional regulator [Novosphingobium sp. BK258]MBB3419687.1 DNA-binding MarR family transcriptional regulator [Novosphingobium sp. BK267]MBB3447992.1 DNA-binding MarR family trans